LTRNLNRCINEPTEFRTRIALSQDLSAKNGAIASSCTSGVHFTPSFDHVSGCDQQGPTQGHDYGTCPTRIRHTASTRTVRSMPARSVFRPSRLTRPSLIRVPRSL